MVLDLMRWCAVIDAYGEMVVLLGYRAMGMESFVNVVRSPERRSGMQVFALL